VRLPQFHSPLATLVFCLLLLLVVHYLDYISGVENSMLLFYLVPIALATWRFGISGGIVFSILSVAGSVASDLLAGVVRVNTWNVISELGGYSVVVFLLARWHDLLQQMQSRIEARTAALRRELAARRQLEGEMAAVTERERERVGRELHDSLCQHLTGTSLLAETVSMQLANSNEPVAEKARKVVSLIDQGIELTREIARGLLSFEFEASGLTAALQSLAKCIRYDQQIDCRVTEAAISSIPRPIANHLYWIAREAVINAVKHGQPSRIEISLRGGNDNTELLIEDDGGGLDPNGAQSRGLGIKLMERRAQLAGANLQITNAHPHGVIVRCQLNNGS
jgi:signal transduction histidine kinase